MNNLSERTSKIPYSLPSKDVAEINYVIDAMKSSHRHGAGSYTARAVERLSGMTKADKILLTQSCTAALEFAMMLIEVGAGDEIILPSFTFSSTANAVVLRGATPVFADIDPKTQCLDPLSVEKLINWKTRAIIPVHYAGVACDMDSLSSLARKHSLAVIEDAAQTIGSTLHGRALGTFGELGAFSFHDSKNISCGEGGALLVNDPQYIERAEILWEKGTNRSQFMRGQVDKYTWVDIGSSFLPSEVTAAFLLGQLERVDRINQARCDIWNRYYAAFAQAERDGHCVRPFVPTSCEHNSHIFYLMMPDEASRNGLLDHLHHVGVSATFHYVPLHDSPAGRKYGKSPIELPNTIRAGRCLLRLPIYPDLTLIQQSRIIDEVNNHFNYRKSSLVDLIEISNGS